MLFLLRPPRASSLSSRPSPLASFSRPGPAVLPILPRLLRNGAFPPPAAAVTATTAASTRAMSSARKRRQSGPPPDPRIKMIRYFLWHPAQHTPRPLKFGTMRMLRHWTIHRAWQLFKMNERNARERELERQYNRIREAMEELARTDERLYKMALGKQEVGTFPIELRIPTDTPPRSGWNHNWRA